MTSAFQHPLDPVTDGLEITVSHQGTTSTLQLAGECDIAQQERIHERLQEIRAARPECVVLDLSRLSFIDSTGLSIVIGLQKWTEANGVRLVICRGPKAVQRIFELTGLGSTLPFLPAGGADQTNGETL